jgi:hypothetical protein
VVKAEVDFIKSSYRANCKEPEIIDMSTALNPAQSAQPRRRSPLPRRHRQASDTERDIEAQLAVFERSVRNQANSQPDMAMADD